MEERVYFVEHVFRDGGRYRDLLRQRLANRFLDTPIQYCNLIHNIVDKFRETLWKASKAIGTETFGYF